MIRTHRLVLREKIQPCAGFQGEVTEASKWRELFPVNCKVGVSNRVERKCPFFLFCICNSGLNFHFRFIKKREKFGCHISIS